MARVPSLEDRASGLLLHPTSLPASEGSGALGNEARAFVDLLASAKQRWWQTLPLGPPGYGESPYAAQSAFAGNAALLGPDGLEDTRRDRGFDAFAEENADWLPDFALFRAIKRANGGVQWTRWSEPLKHRDPRALAAARAEHARVIDREMLEQYAFDRRWRALRAYANDRGIGVIGDLPIFVAHDSADVWQHPELFFLDDSGEPSFIAGVPPDYFSATGQRWGNPLYRWRRMKKTGYAWWLARLRSALRWFDVIRVDHFIGFQRYWRIPASEPTAVGGTWMKGPGSSFFRAARAALGGLPLIAEDLGAVTPAVFALRDRFGLPGIKILQFAFGNDPSAPTFVPHNYPRGSVVYTGTHDNDTTVGWFRDEGGAASTRTHEQIVRERAAALRYLGTDGAEIHWDMIRLAFASVANLAIAPVQDVLGLGNEARMNRPGTDRGNWTWQLRPGQLSAAHADRLRVLAETYGRGG